MAAGAYSSRVLIGNWSEDLELEQTKLREFLDRKERGGLALDRSRAAARQVALSVADDGCLHVGDNCMLLNECTSGFLSVDTADSVSAAGTKHFGVATALSETPAARSVFVITRAEEVYDDDGRIRYGDKIRFGTHEALSGKPLFLHSQLVSTTSYAKKTRFQELSVTPKGSWATVWEFVHFDPLLRFEAEGRVVPANGRVVLRHCATNAALASPAVPVVTSFGAAFEACVHTYLNAHKAETAENHWIAVLAVPEEPEPESQLAPGGNWL
eukprot:a511888_6.p1 GENE.a511888_6~~a511888_6.p1  ORF type:complete len:284 (-),score=79.26 a511888_6:29-838(-)